MGVIGCRAPVVAGLKGDGVKGNASGFRKPICEAGYKVQLPNICVISRFHRACSHFLSAFVKNPG